MRLLYLITLLFIILILQACTFEPNGEHFMTVDPTSKTPNVRINLNFNTDTLFIPRQETITFAYGMTNSDAVWAKLIFNGKEISMMTYSKDTVKLVCSFFDNAGTIGPLELQIFYHSKTGSLGDLVGAEGVLFKKKWIVKLMDDKQLSSTITKAEFVDGTLKLSWTRFPGSEFTNYKIYKEISFFPLTIQLVATITSRDQLSCTDNTYHGEMSDYTIRTNDEFNSPTYTVKGPVPTVSATCSQSGDIILKWTKPPFYKNLRGYRITTYDHAPTLIQLGDVTDGTAESYTVPTPLFGESNQYFLTLLPKTNSYYDENNPYLYISSNTFATYGFPSPKFDFAHAGLAPISYLLVNYYNQSINVFDNQKMATVRKIKVGDINVSFDVSANNKYLVASTGVSQKMYFDYLTDTTKSKMIVSKYFAQMSGNYSVSDVGTGVFINGQNAIIYDYLNEQKLAELQLKDYYVTENKISPSGNFFYCKTSSIYCDYYRYKDNQITLLTRGNIVNDPLNYIEYLPGLNEKLVMVRSKQIEVLDCNTAVTEHTWQFPNGFTQFYNLDKKSGKVLFREKNKLILFDVITGTRQELRNIAGSIDYINPWQLFYNNGLLLGGNGSSIY